MENHIVYINMPNDSVEEGENEAKYTEIYRKNSKTQEGNFDISLIKILCIFAKYKSKFMQVC